MVTEPTLLLADEPTGNLDSRTSVEVMALFQALNDQGITILIVTHEPDIAQYARRVVEVRDGRILRDHPITSRRSAVDDLTALDDAGPASGQEAA
jgi:putative ABC transport system ATP-binding protein